MADAKLNPGKGMVIDGVIASAAIDSSGEILEVEGCDVSSLERDGVLNTEHKNASDEKADWSTVIGRCIKVKKIYESKDCEDDRQRYFWDIVKLPFIYGQFRLFDGSGHRAASEAAAIIRDAFHAGEPPLINFSIEGSTLDREGNVLKRSIARAVAATIRPCNKSAISGVLLDPNGPALPDTEPKSLLDGVAEDAKKFERPTGTRLGGFSLQYHPLVQDPTKNTLEDALLVLRDLNKTITAGMPSGAPGSRTGGAALQVEDLRHRVINQAKAAVRDYDPHQHGDFKSFLKFKLPEASEKFINRFSDLVDELKIRSKTMVKKEPGAKKVKKQPSAPKEPTPIDSAEPAPVDRPGFKVKKIAGMKRGNQFFDEDAGVLHLPVGSFRVYIPKNEPGYEKVLNDPKLNKIHQKAMDSWIGLHRLSRQGKLPSEVLAHAALFSAMSPNTAVPIQELAYGFMQDMQAKGFDPTRHPGGEADRWSKEWDRVTKGQMLPEYMRDHFANPNSGVWTKDGRRQMIGLGQQKLQGATNYHNVHNMLDYLYQSSGGDARQTAGMLNHMKNLATSREGREVGAPDVKGFAPKTIRYMLGMAGGGNVVVPDTHFIRHTFGLPLGDPRNEAIKSYLWDSRNEPMLAGLDRFYYNHHPAVAKTRQVMQQRYGEDLGEHALFPSFWLHWLTIQAHDRERGWDSRAHNSDTDHDVYWNSVRRVLDKYKIPHDGSLVKMESAYHATLSARTAHAYHELHDHFGHGGASLAYYAFMVPALTGSTQVIHKAAAMLADLKKAKRAKKEEKVQPVEFRGNLVQPGEIELGGREGWRDKMRAPLLHVDDTFHYFRDPDTKMVGKVQNKHLGKGFKVLKPHQIIHDASIVHAGQHGLPHLSESPEQIDLLDGIDFAGKPAADAFHTELGITDNVHYRKSASGKVGFIKPSVNMLANGHDVRNYIDMPDEFSTAQREAAFHTLARDVFGLGHHVPVTAAFKHPVTGVHHSVQEAVDAPEHYTSHPDHEAAIQHLGEFGVLDKMALMDMVLGHHDRHSLNFLMTPGRDPHIHLIDNGFAFTSKRHVPRPLPFYWVAHSHLNGDRAMNQQVHPSAIEWIRGLDPAVLRGKMKHVGVPDAMVDESVRRLEALKGRAEKGRLSRTMAYLSPFLNPKGK